MVYFYNLVRTCVDLAVYTEIMALWEMLLVAVTLSWVSTHSFIFEFDTQFVVVWAVDPLSVP